MLHPRENPEEGRQKVHEHLDSNRRAANLVQLGFGEVLLARETTVAQEITQHIGQFPYGGIPIVEDVARCCIKTRKHSESYLNFQDVAALNSLEG
jgi:hypothetical protein